MPNMGDMARMMAAQGGMGMTGGPEENPELEAPPEGLAEEGASDPVSDLMGAVDAIEAAIPGLPGEVSQKLSQQVEALRAIIEEASAMMNSEGAPPAEGGPSAAPPPGAEGAMAAGEMEGA